MKNIKYIVFVALFMIIAILPFVGMTFYKNDGSAEQRTLAEKPALVKEGKLNTEYATEYEDYFGDNFAFRTELVDADAAIKLNVFKSSSESKVITGKDNWLFYAETLDSYSGLNKLTDGELSRLTEILKLESDYCKAFGKGYVFTVAPNKNSVYPEMMADYYVKSDEPSDLDRLNESLEKAGVGVLDLKKELTTAKSTGTQLYYTYDSHWNYYGAMVGYHAIMDSVRDVSGFGTTYADFTGEALADTNGEREGDLLKMVRPLHANAFEIYSQSPLKEYFKYVGKKPANTDALTIQTTLKEPGDNDTNLLMFRDSFGRAIITPLANSFAKAKFLRSMPFAIYGNIDENTVVVREIVERNIKLLLTSAPLIPAQPVTSDFSEYKKFDVTMKEEKSENSGNLVHYFGYGIPAEEADDYRVLVTVGSETLEAFPLVEASFEDTPDGAIGYSFYLTEETEFTISFVKK